MTARRAAATSAGMALVGTAAAVLWSGPLAPAWPSASPTVIGVWSIETLSAVPIGDPLQRAAAAAACLAAITAALNGWILTRLGHDPLGAAGAALTIGLLSYGGPALATDLPASLASVLTTTAIAVALVPGRAPLVRAIASAVLQLAAGMFQPAAFGALPLVVAHACGRSMAVRALAGAFGVFAATWWWAGGPAWITDEAGTGLLSQAWLWPVAMIMVSGALAPLWGRPAAGTAIVGTAVMVALVGAGHEASALAVYPTLLLAAGVASLPGLGRRVRVALMGGLLAVSLAEAWRVPPPPSWPLVAWRDGVERAVPAGTRLHTGNAAAAALNGPLFHGRPSRITVVASARPPRSGHAEARYLLEDFAGTGAPADGGLTPVPVTYADVADFVMRLPEGTIVGVAIAVSDPEVGPDAARAVLALLGHSEPPDAAALAAAGIVGEAPAAGLVRDDGRVHVLIGDPLGADGRRSPADFELRSAADGVSVSLRGRVLATGRRWAVIALRPGGPLIQAMADGDGQTPWPIRLPGLQVWRD